MKGWIYILECYDGSYYTGSTNDLELRMQQHQNGEGANHTKKHLPVKLVYVEEFQRIDDAFQREKQIQGWSRNKKEALINRDFVKLPGLSKNYTQFPPPSTSTTSTPSTSSGTGGTVSTGMASTGSATGNTTKSESTTDKIGASTGSATGNAMESDSATVPEPVEGTTPLMITPVPEPVEGVEGTTSLKHSILNNIHHTAIICSDYEKSKAFYVDILGLEVIHETYRKERQSYKLDLALNGRYVIELFSFPNPPQRVSRPEATGLRHLAFEVNDIEAIIKHLKANDIEVEPIRIDEFTNKRFTFTADPDDLPIEFYEK